MREKTIKPLVTAFLLSAALSLGACSAPSETVQGDISTSFDAVETVSESEKAPESKTAENKKENRVSEETTSEKTENIEEKTSSLPAETVQSPIVNTPAAVEEQTAETDEPAPIPKPVTKSAENNSAQSLREQPSSSVGTTAHAPITTTEAPIVTSTPITEIVQSTEPQPAPTEPSESESAFDFISEPVFNPISESVSETLAASAAEAPSAPALTGGKYQQRYCTPTEQEFADRVFELTNAERLKEGLPPFEKMDTLKTIALTRAWELTVEYRGDHTRPDATTFTGAFNENGIIYGAWGENIAAGQDSPESVVAAWMNSPSHRAAILDKNYTYMGVGYYYIKDDYQNYYHFWTQEFYCY